MEGTVSQYSSVGRSEGGRGMGKSKVPEATTWRGGGGQAFWISNPPSHSLSLLPQAGVGHYYSANGQPHICPGNFFGIPLPPFSHSHVSFFLYIIILYFYTSKVPLPNSNSNRNSGSSHATNSPHTCPLVLLHSRLLRKITIVSLPFPFFFFFNTFYSLSLFRFLPSTFLLNPSEVQLSLPAGRLLLVIIFLSLGKRGDFPSCSSCLLFSGRICGSKGVKMKSARKWQLRLHPLAIISVAVEERDKSLFRFGKSSRIQRRKTGTDRSFSFLPFFYSTSTVFLFLFLFLSYPAFLFHSR